MKDLIYYSNLAKNILKEDTKYLKDKELIAYSFKINKDPLDKIIFRLTMIDSYYSTQMGKRFFGIEEIAESIINISHEDDYVKKSFLGYLRTPKDFLNIECLFKKRYGYHKTGGKAGKASSIISKYAYFLTGFNFPIFDKMVQNSYPEIIKKFNYNLPSIPSECNYNYFECLINLSKISGINNFEQLDNLLWLYGKLKGGSFSLILNKDKYLKLVGEINWSNENIEKMKSDKVDDEIRKFIKNLENQEFLHQIFSEKSVEFIYFCYDVSQNFA